MLYLFRDILEYRIYHLFSQINLMEASHLYLIVSVAIRSLCSLKFRDNHLDRNFGRMVFNTLLDASPTLSILDLSGNDVSNAFPQFLCSVLNHFTIIWHKTSYTIMQMTGWLSNLARRSSSEPLTSLGVGKSLQSLCMLNLRYQLIEVSFLCLQIIVH